MHLLVQVILRAEVMQLWPDTVYFLKNIRNLEYVLSVPQDCDMLDQK